MKKKEWIKFGMFFAVVIFCYLTSALNNIDIYMIFGLLMGFMLLFTIEIQEDIRKIK